METTLQDTLQFAELFGSMVAFVEDKEIEYDLPTSMEISTFLAAVAFLKDIDDDKAFLAISNEIARAIVKGEFYLDNETIIKKDEDIYFSTEFEFYLFKMDEEGQNTLIPYDNASYMDIAPDDKGENVRREICLSLHEMEIQTGGSHHAYGPGQNKIILVEDKPLYAAENMITFESVVKTIAARNGLYADFSHRPKEDLAVSSHQIRIKVKKDKLEKYYNNLKKHYDEIYLFLNNTSYLYDEYDEKKNIILDEFSSSIVINRVSYTSDPYLAYSLIMYALFDEEESSLKKAYTLNEAKEIASCSKFIKKHIPEELLNFYIK